jgi:hypothetical protein
MNRKYKEIEFQCYNTDYPEGTIKLLQLKAYNVLKGIEGILPYMQDFSDDNHEERSLAVIILDYNNSKKLEEKIIKIGNSFNLNFDLNNEVEEWKINEILRGGLDNLYIPNFKNVISYDFDGVLHKSVIGTHPINYYDYNTWTPNMDIINDIKIKSIKNKIVVVSARNMDMIPAMWSFIKKHNIQISEIFTTENDYIDKVEVLENIDAMIHYDDYIIYKQQIERAGITFIHVKNS